VTWYDASSVHKGRAMGWTYEEAIHFPSNPDLRGKRAEEVVAELKRFLDDAICLRQAN